MKKVLCAIAFFLTNYFTSFAQSELPTYSKIKVAHVHQSITDYQNGSLILPSSFLMDTTGIRTYLLNTVPNDCYLHIYVAKNGVDTYLAMVGAAYISGKRIHDPAITEAWRTRARFPNCRTVYDAIIDGPDQNVEPTQQNPIGCQPGKIQNRKDIVNDVKEYNNEANANYTTAFLINANQLRDYLAAKPNVKYLQVYLAQDAALPTTITTDQLSLVIVGVDNGGNHVYSSGPIDGVNYVFDEVVPCPVCKIEDDLVMGPMPPRTKKK